MLIRHWTPNKGDSIECEVVGFVFEVVDGRNSDNATDPRQTENVRWNSSIERATIRRNGNYIFFRTKRSQASKVRDWCKSRILFRAQVFHVSWLTKGCREMCNYKTEIEVNGFFRFRPAIDRILRQRIRVIVCPQSVPIVIQHVVIRIQCIITSLANRFKWICNRFETHATMIDSENSVDSIFDAMTSWRRVTCV